MYSFTGREIKILIADDHEIVRAGIKRLLSIDKSLIIIDEAANGAVAVELTKYHKPDIVLLDIRMPQMDGIEATSIIKRDIPGTLVVILTAYEQKEHLEKALKVGADGYLSKDISSKNLVDSLHKVYNGERVFSKSIVDMLQKKNVTEDDYNTIPIGISKREQQILNLVAHGKTSKEIASELNISIRTVQAHRSNIIQKLDIRTSAGLVRYGVLHEENSNIKNN